MPFVLNKIRNRNGEAFLNTIEKQTRVKTSAFRIFLTPVKKSFSDTSSKGIPILPAQKL
jgi:hypothetical protein